MILCLMLGRAGSCCAQHLIEEGEHLTPHSVGRHPQYLDIVLCGFFLPSCSQNNHLLRFISPRASCPHRPGFRKVTGLWDGWGWTEEVGHHGVNFLAPLLTLLPEPHDLSSCVLSDTVPCDPRLKPVQIMNQIFLSSFRL